MSGPVTDRPRTSDAGGASSEAPAAGAPAVEDFDAPTPGLPSPLPEPHPNGDGRGAEAERRTRELIEELLTLLGEDPTRAGLRDTPERAARALRWLTSGYERSADEVIGTGVFEERHDSMVLIRDLEIYSLCEHHMLPFFGRAHVAYVPDGRVVGLSKIARVADLFARRLQVQERLTDQIADALVDAIAPRGVGVVIEARHLCMMMRGVEKQNSRTITSAVRGELAESAARREEFLRLAVDRARGG